MSSILTVLPCYYLLYAFVVLMWYLYLNIGFCFLWNIKIDYNVSILKKIISFLTHRPFNKEYPMYFTWIFKYFDFLLNFFYRLVSIKLLTTEMQSTVSCWVSITEFFGEFQFIIVMFTMLHCVWLIIFSFLQVSLFLASMRQLTPGEKEEEE